MNSKYHRMNCMEHRSAQAKQELILQEFLEKHHFDPPAAILPQLRIVTQKERDTLLKKGTRSMPSTLSWKVSTPSVKPGAMAAIFIFTELGPGDFICEMECYQGAQAVQYNLICKSDSLLLAVPVEGFLAWQAVDPGLCQMLIQSLIPQAGLLCQNRQPDAHCIRHCQIRAVSHRLLPGKRHR